MAGMQYIIAIKYKQGVLIRCCVPTSDQSAMSGVSCSDLSSLLTLSLRSGDLQNDIWNAVVRAITNCDHRTRCREIYQAFSCLLVNTAAWTAAIH